MLMSAPSTRIPTRFKAPSSGLLRPSGVSLDGDCDGEDDDKDEVGPDWLAGPDAFVGGVDGSGPVKRDALQSLQVWHALFQ